MLRSCEAFKYRDWLMALIGTGKVRVRTPVLEIERILGLQFDRGPNGH